MFFNRKRIKELSFRVAELEGSVAALMLAVIDLSKKVKPKKNNGKENTEATK